MPAAVRTTFWRRSHTLGATQKSAWPSQAGDSKHSVHVDSFCSARLFGPLSLRCSTPGNSFLIATPELTMPTTASYSVAAEGRAPRQARNRSILVWISLANHGKQLVMWVGPGQNLRHSITFCHECFSRTNTLEPQNLTPSGEPAFYNLGPRFHSPPHFNPHL
jgi:hypothetical protein